MILNNIYKKYKDRVVLDIDNISFDDGKVYAIIGPNGSGKSTLGKIISKVIKNDKHIELDNNVIYMPQKSFAFNMSVYKNASLNISDKEKVEEYMTIFGLNKIAKQNAKGLSGGELSKVSLIRTLLSNSKTIILDEPTASMDIDAMIKAEELIKKTNIENKTTIILITHSISQAKRLADHIIFLDKGKVIDDSLTPKTIDKTTNPIIKNFIDLYSK